MTILAADIGGTNSRFALIDGRSIKKYEACKTKEITDLAKRIDTFLKGSKVRRGAIAVAGSLTMKNGRRRVVQNNGHLIVDERELERKSRLTQVKVLNDFKALALAVPLLKAKQIHTLKRGSGKGIVVLVGPGTGLGQAIITERETLQSEGHHTDIPLYGMEEYTLAAFTNEEMGTQQGSPVWHEELLSGRGLERLYRFLRFTRFKKGRLPPRLTAEEISATREKNACSAATFTLFERLLARRCRNFALETKALGGLYLAGGVVTKNLAAWSDAFVEEFTRHAHPQWRKMLERMPVRIITDERACLLGAATVLKRRF